MQPSCERTEIHDRPGCPDESEAQESAQRPHPDPPGVEHEFGDVGKSELALALFTVHEVNRYFLHYRAECDGLVSSATWKA